MSSSNSPIGLDPNRFEAWLVESGLGVVPPLRFERIGQGKSNLIILLTDAKGQRLVLRRPPLGSLLASAHDVAREGRILGGLVGSGVPAPRPLALCEDESVCEVPVLVMEFVEGLIVDGPGAAASLSAAARTNVGPAMATALAGLHALDLRAAGLDSLASHENYASRQLRRWGRQWEASRTRELPTVESVTARLESRIPEQRETCLVHGDFSLVNCVVDPADGSVKGILDWELSTLGDPLADVGTFLAYWTPEGEYHPLGEPFGATGLPGFGGPRDLLAAYADASGRELGAINFWLALACWKLAIIVEGISRRHLQDPTNPPGPGLAATELMLERAAEALDDSTGTARA